MLDNIKEKLIINSEPGTFHNYIYEKLKANQLISSENIIKRKEIVVILYRQNIPKNCHNKFLKEMQKYGLIKLKNRRNIEIL